MKRRLLKKIVKKYGDSWWTVLNDTETSCSYALVPPGKWNNKKILDEFHRQRLRKGIYYYKIAIY